MDKYVEGMGKDGGEETGDDGEEEDEETEMDDVTEPDTAGTAFDVAGSDADDGEAKGKVEASAKGSGGLVRLWVEVIKNRK